MLRPGPEALAAVDTDLDQAWRDGVVDMRVLVGNPSSVSATLVAPPPGTLKH